MIEITKIFRFEMAHAIHGYPGSCKDIHGHSYVLHVTVTSAGSRNAYIPEPGFIMDYKELKKIVNDAIIDKLDHHLLLSEAYLQSNPRPSSQNLFIWTTEPSAENLLIFIQQQIKEKLPARVQLVKLRLYETNDSYAEWINEPLPGDTLYLTGR